jgi:hypothetical protein
MVQIRIERAISGLTQIEITADKPETLLALQRDQPALHRTLDQAGVPPAGRTISFHSVPPAQASSGTDNATSNQSGGHGTSARAGYLNSDADGSAGNGRGGYFGREGNRWRNARHQATESDNNVADVPTKARDYVAGLNITA